MKSDRPSYLMRCLASSSRLDALAASGFARLDHAICADVSDLVRRAGHALCIYVPDRREAPDLRGGDEADQPGRAVRVVTRPHSINVMTAQPTLQGMVGEVDMFKDFLNGYKKVAGPGK